MAFRTDGETQAYWQGSPSDQKRTWRNLDSPDPDAFGSNLMKVKAKSQKAKKRKKNRNMTDNYVGRSRSYMA